jgi:hypothetical protein
MNRRTFLLGAVASVVSAPAARGIVANEFVEGMAQRWSEDVVATIIYGWPEASFEGYNSLA